MKQLKYELKELCKYNRDGSHATQADRHQSLQKMANDLYNLGYRKMAAKSIKPKHVEALIKSYINHGISVGTLKNRMTHLRWWASKVNKQNVIARDNADYGIGQRELVAKTSKAQTLDIQKLESITDPHIKMSLELQAAFGLRREEAIKFSPEYADLKNHIQLKPTWCKGGKKRTVPIRTEAQREVLDRAKVLAGRGSLIPPHRQYVQQMQLYERLTLKAGLSNMHGLRHAYAQTRYENLTGWLCPACGGPTSAQLNTQQKQIDLKARLVISKELGHKREQITASYLGR